MADVSEEVPIKDAATAISQGKRHLLVRDYNLAVVVLAQACELLAQKHGETGDEMGELYLLYGRALLGLAREEAGVLGGGVPGSEEVSQDEQGEEEEEEESEEGTEGNNTAENSSGTLPNGKESDDQEPMTVEENEDSRDTKDKAAEKSKDNRDKAVDKTEEKAEEKAEEKVDEKAKEKAKEKTEEKAGKEDNEKAEEKTEGKTEKKMEEPSKTIDSNVEKIKENPSQEMEGIPGCSRDPDLHNNKASGSRTKKQKKGTEDEEADTDEEEDVEEKENDEDDVNNLQVGIISTDPLFFFI